MFLQMLFLDHFAFFLKLSLPCHFFSRPLPRHISQRFKLILPLLISLPIILNHFRVSFLFRPQSFRKRRRRSSQFNKRFRHLRHFLKASAQLHPPQFLHQFELFIKKVDLVVRTTPTKLLNQFVTHVLPRKDADEFWNLTLNIGFVKNRSFPLLRQEIRRVDRSHVLSIQHILLLEVFLTLGFIK